MKWFKPVISVMIQNFRKWRQDCRIWISLALLMIFIHSATSQLSVFCDYADIKCTPWIYPFLYMQHYQKILYFLPLILIFSNAPFTDNNQLYMILRCGRIRWCLGQICYIIAASAIYFLFIIFASVLLNLKCMTFSGEWGKILTTLANTNAGSQFQIAFSVNRNVIDMFTPFQATWFTFLHSWASGIILGLVIFLANTKLKGIGTFFAAFLLVFSALASKQPSMVKYSPITWSTLNYIHLTQNDLFPSYGYITVSYILLFAVLLLVMLVIARRYSFEEAFRK